MEIKLEKGRQFLLETREDYSDFYSHLRGRIYWAIGDTDSFDVQIGRKVKNIKKSCDRFKDLFNIFKVYEKNNATILAYKGSVLVYFDSKDYYFRIIKKADTHSQDTGHEERLSSPPAS